MTNQEWITLFFSRSYEKQINNMILDDVDYVVPIDSLLNYVLTLIEIPYSDFLEQLPTYDYFILKSRDLPEADSLGLCSSKVVDYMLKVDNYGIEPDEYASYCLDITGNSGYSKSDSLRCLRTAKMLGLTFEYFGRWYLNCLGYVYYDLTEEEQAALYARTLLRSNLYNRLVHEARSFPITIENILPTYDVSYARRFIPGINQYLSFCIDEAADSGIRLYPVVSNTQRSKKKKEFNGTYLEGLYYNEIKGSNFLSLEDCHDLARRIRYEAGRSTYSRNELVTRSLMFAYRQARYYAGRGLPVEDIIQEISLITIKAAENYSELYGAHFLSYLSSLIKGLISIVSVNYLSPIKINQRRLQQLWQLRKEQERFYVIHERTPLAYECSLDATDSEMEELQKMPEDLHELTISVDYENYLADEEQDADYFCIHEDNCYRVKKYLALLPDERSRSIVKMVCGIGYPYSYSLAEIADKMNLSRERVRQLYVKAIRRIKSRLGLIRRNSPQFVKEDEEEQIKTDDGKLDKLKKRAQKYIANKTEAEPIPCDDLTLKSTLIKPQNVNTYHPMVTKGVSVTEENAKRESDVKSAARLTEQIKQYKKANNKRYKKRKKRNALLGLQRRSKKTN